MAGYDEFVDPNSAIARIIAQMQGAANRSNPDALRGGIGVSPGMAQHELRPGGAQPPHPMGMEEEDPQEMIQRLLEMQMSGQVNR